MQGLNTENLEEELWVAEYNFGQKCFHHSFLKDTIKKNNEIIKRNILDGKNSLTCWIPFEIGTRKETADAITMMRGYMIENGYRGLGLV